MLDKARLNGKHVTNQGYQLDDEHGIREILIMFIQQMTIEFTASKLGCPDVARMITVQRLDPVYHVNSLSI